ncbi:MAG: SLOG family protein, partial [Flammeovirgaceae bacterium]
MKTIVAGSRGIADYEVVLAAIRQSGFEVTEVVSGTARGVDKLGERYAIENVIPITRFVPDWDKHGKRAGYLRNTEMGDYADALIAVWDGES